MGENITLNFHNSCKEDIAMMRHIGLNSVCISICLFAIDVIIRNIKRYIMKEKIQLWLNIKKLPKICDIEY